MSCSRRLGDPGGDKYLNPPEFSRVRTRSCAGGPTAVERLFRATTLRSEEKFFKPCRTQAEHGLGAGAGDWMMAASGTRGSARATCEDQSSGMH